MSEVWVVIVTYNGRQWVDACLHSLQQSDISVRIVVVDNASNDNTRQQIAKFPEVETILLNHNIGFGKANNIGIRYALEKGAAYIFLLNQDVRVQPDTLQRLLDCAEKNPAAGILSPVHLNGDETALDEGFVFYVKNSSNHFISDAYLQQLKPWYPMKQVNAAAWLITRDCLLKVGGFDPLFFMYGEDNDLCNRAIFHGFEIALVPEARIYHHRDFSSRNRVDSQFITAVALSPLKHPQGKFINHLTFYLWQTFYIIITGRKRGTTIKSMKWILLHLPKIYWHTRKSRQKGSHWIL